MPVEDFGPNNKAKYLSRFDTRLAGTSWRAIQKENPHRFLRFALTDEYKIFLSYLHHRGQQSYGLDVSRTFFEGYVDVSTRPVTFREFRKGQMADRLFQESSSINTAALEAATRVFITDLFSQKLHARDSGSSDASATRGAS